MFKKANAAGPTKSYDYYQQKGHKYKVQDHKYCVRDMFVMSFAQPSS